MRIQGQDTLMLTMINILIKFHYALLYLKRVIGISVDPKMLTPRWSQPGLCLKNSNSDYSVIQFITQFKCLPSFIVISYILTKLRGGRCEPVGYLLTFDALTAVKGGGPFNPNAPSGESIKLKSATGKSFFEAKRHLKTNWSRSHYNNKVFRK